ncbi:MAG: hypothetical protein JXA94_01280 [Parachlamydiales bacterium]|nr:hypothetical protein [Parachlamydiales bacterium]
MIKIAIPINKSVGLQSKIAEHFGRCEFYLVLNENGIIIESIENNSFHNSGTKSPPEILADNNITYLLCKNLGPKALSLCNASNISVYLDHTSIFASEIFHNWKQKKLVEANQENACKDHK